MARRSHGLQAVERSGGARTSKSNNPEIVISSEPEIEGDIVFENQVRLRAPSTSGIIRIRSPRLHLPHEYEYLRVGGVP